MGLEMSPSHVGTRSSANTEPQLLTESGPIQLKDYNPKGVLRFTGRLCVTCRGEIMDHWLRHGSHEFWCTKDGDMASEGITGCQFNVEGVSAPQEKPKPRDNDYA